MLTITTYDSDISLVKLVNNKITNFEIMNALQKICFASLFLISLTVSAQYSIKPGRGFENISIGSHIDAVIKLLGNPLEVKSRFDEKSAWNNFGYTADSTFTFQIDFDSVYQFDNNNDRAIWKVFCRGSEVVFMSLSSYGNEQHDISRVNVSGEIFFGDNLQQVIDKFGPNYYTKIDGFGNEEFVYLGRGVRFILSEDKIRNIYIFKPIKKKRQKQIIQNVGLRHS